MKKFKIHTLLITFVISIAFVGAKNPTEPPVLQNDGKNYFVSLKDFTKEEVKGIGFILSKDLTINIKAIGGGSKNAWIQINDDERSAAQMFAGAWIINADTREMVWEMTMNNTSGKEELRKYDDDIQLKQGSYEVYYAAYGFVQSSAFSYSSSNIDRRNSSASNNFALKFFKFFDDESMYDQFMVRAKDDWFVTLSIPENEKSSVEVFNAPKKNPNAIFSGTGVGDKTYMRKRLTVSKDVEIHVYAVGEGRKNDEMFDYGWIVNEDNRDRVWQMNLKNSRYAGGSAKNLKFDGVVKLPKGKYELTFVTDDSHSREDFNAKPPYDPFNYGITISVQNESEKNDVQISDYSNEKKNVIVALTKVRDENEVSAGFSLKSDSKIRVYALGEVDNNKRDMADYGWITNVKTRERVWEMNFDKSFHAGGASKNRMVDEVINLPKGDYLVYYVTDDSHAYNDWNDDAPYDPESWGITVMGAGENFSPSTASSFAEETESNVIAQLIKVRDDKHVHQRFTIEKSGNVRVYCIGEAEDRDMADYGWIEDVKTGQVIWEMTYRMTTNAGGAKKNRLVNKTIYLEKGEYELHYKTDDSHAYGDWNDNAPEDRFHYGITIYKE